MALTNRIEIGDDQAARLQRLANRPNVSADKAGARLLEEALRRASEFLGVVFRNSPVDREAYVAGSRLAVWEVVSLATTAGPQTKPSNICAGTCPASRPPSITPPLSPTRSMPPSPKTTLTIWTGCAANCQTSRSLACRVPFAVPAWLWILARCCLDRVASVPASRAVAVVPVH